MTNWIEKRAVMVVTFDDGLHTHFTKAYPILKERGIKGTCYVITSRTDFFPTAIMSFNDVLRMKELGWAMECHTHTHRNLGTLTDAEQRQEMENVDATFLSIGLEKPEHTCYPQGGYTPSGVEVIAEFRKSQRHTGHLATHFNDISTMQLKSLRGINADFPDATHLQVVKECIDNTVANGGVMVPYTHAFTSQTIPLFTEMIEYAQSKGMEFITITELEGYLNRAKGNQYNFIR